ncbi:hypothetical protein K466DRAFT_193188 [Polyporus arcularius HHB13444]|uniref:Uncharacterized protein n=1 Tax=Polyporus arcularius HHB13444 TaxID=1314778 RepID=A0A5C3PY52_9APHY|nr:hypothetical protein K466DRAFT_193188 [Polyporus arcularius HHB13444]
MLARSWRIFSKHIWTQPASFARRRNPSLLPERALSQRCLVPVLLLSFASCSIFSCPTHVAQGITLIRPLLLHTVHHDLLIRGAMHTQELQIRIWIYESAHRSSTVPRHDASGLTGHAVISRPWLAASPDSWALAVRLPTHSNRWIAHLDRMRLPSLSAQRQLASCILNLPYVVHLGSVLQRLSTKHGTNYVSASLHDHLPR